MAVVLSRSNLRSDVNVRRASVRGDNACARFSPVCQPYPLQRFPQMVHKGPLNTLFQGVKTVHPPPRQSPKGGKRGTKVLNTVGAYSGEVER